MVALLERVIAAVSVQDVIALFFTLIVGFLWASGQEVPEGLLNVTLIIIGFFFGDKNAQRAQANTIELMNPKPAAPYIAQ
jgi:hypothetical protein